MADTINFFSQALWLMICMAAPPLLVATITGVVVSIVQAVTQIQDQSLSFVVKLAAVSISLSAMGRWFSSEIIQLANIAFGMIPNVGR